MSVNCQILSQARVKQNQQATAPGRNEFDLQDAGLIDSDNEAYEEAREKKQKKKATKSAKYTAVPTHAPMEEEVLPGPRKVTKEVDQNRGLTPHRRKDMKNPRVKVYSCSHI